MSVKIMGLVWDLDIDRDEKYILLAYADHADHEGGNIRPSVDLIARKTGVSKRTVQRHTRSLQDAGYLIPEGGQKGGRGRTARWRIPIKGDKLTPIPIKGDNQSTERVTSTTLKGDIAVSPESSLTIKEPLKVLTDQQLMVQVLEEVTGLAAALNGSRLGRAATQLIKANIPRESIQDIYRKPGGWWYKYDWRGQRGQQPTPEQVIETVGRGRISHQVEDEEPPPLEPEDELDEEPRWYDESLMFAITRNTTPLDAWNKAIVQLRQDVPKIYANRYLQISDVDVARYDHMGRKFYARAKDLETKEWLESRATTTLERILVGICDKSVTVEIFVGEED